MPIFGDHPLAKAELETSATEDIIADLSSRLKMLRIADCLREGTPGGYETPDVQDGVVVGAPPDSPSSDHSVEATDDVSSESSSEPPVADAANPPSNSNDAFGGDAALDRILKKKPLAAIFVHAGAGFHSHTNERIHLEACSNAAAAGMRHMKAGGTSVDGVEAAIKSLENNTITNAGLGSNLCIDGTVECDATVVDHLGRSGAVGAAPNIPHPISLARVVLDQTSVALALRRIPPNLLVGTGARDFALEHGVRVVDNRDMISANAQDRFEKWSAELDKAHGMRMPSATTHLFEAGVDNPDVPPRARRDHISAILTGTFNEGQPDSPSPQSLPRTPPDLTLENIASFRAHRIPDSPLKPVPAPPPNHGVQAGTPPPKRQRILSPENTSSPRRQSSSPGLANASGAQFDSHDPAQRQTSNDHVQHGQEARQDVDDITDTVGVIAIDHLGHIAAGSSSGGIGMKHRGRIGPAALVGIGTAVVPADDGDPEGKTVAAVTSGTGEHMTTSMSSYKCAERLYHGTVRGPDGTDVAEEDEDKIVESFIVHDFMGHPGVKDRQSSAAIGIMAVKKTNAGYYFFFGHNTESFALASMSSQEKSPRCVMSRLPEAEGQNLASRQRVMRGARKITC